MGTTSVPYQRCSRFERLASKKSTYTYLLVCVAFIALAIPMSARAQLPVARTVAAPSLNLSLRPTAGPIGTPIVLTATGLEASGRVDFAANGSPIGSVNATGSTVSLSTRIWQTGSVNLTATWVRFQAGVLVQSSTSASFTTTTPDVVTTTTVPDGPSEGRSFTASPSPARIGQLVTLRAVGLTPAAGRVDFKAGSTTVGSANVRADGVAQMQTRFYANTTYALTAHWVRYRVGVPVVVDLTTTLTVGTAAPTTTAPPTTTTTTTPVAEGPIIPFTTTATKIVGSPSPGNALQCGAPFGGGGGFQWFAEGQVIASGYTYVVGAGDVGRELFCRWQPSLGSPNTLPSAGVTVRATAGPLPTGTVAVERTGTAFDRTFTCNVTSSGARTRELLWWHPPTQVNFNFPNPGPMLYAPINLTLSNPSLTPQLSCLVYLTNENGTAVIQGGITNPSTPADAPVLSGTPAVGQTLTCTPPSFYRGGAANASSTPPAAFSYTNSPATVFFLQPRPWFATGTTYTVQPGDAGRTIYCLYELTGHPYFPNIDARLQPQQTTFVIFSTPVTIAG